MLEPELFFNTLLKKDISFFSGVPDSLMKGFLTCVQKNAEHHFITANEGAAVAMTTGYYLATNKVGLVYLQNSGLGNAINPLTSLANKEVYGVPMLLMIGWRGQPGKKDEPQHQKMGEIVLQLLQVLGIQYFIFSAGKEWEKPLDDAILLTKKINHPVALVIEGDFFKDTEIKINDRYELSAEQVIESLFDVFDSNTLVICTTGKIGRLFYAVNEKHDLKITKYLMNVGAMGHASSIALALAKFTAEKIVLLDGDGSLLMHMGSLPLAGSIDIDNLNYILLNNGAHQSVGCQPTIGFVVDFSVIAGACGFENTVQITSASGLEQWVKKFQSKKQFIEIRINTKMPENLPRPKESFTSAKENLMKALQIWENDTRNGNGAG
jgi:phosphonopyruvate decarboxylase